MFAISNICTSCFSDNTIGTRVTSDKFFGQLEVALAAHDHSQDRVPGQSFVLLGNDQLQYILSGIGERTNDPDDYVARLHRGRVQAFLRRDKAMALAGCACVVYTREAYLTDPDVRDDEAEVQRILGTSASHVLVAVLGFAGPKPPLTPVAFARNLAGANNEALAWTADEIRAKAKEVDEYDSKYCVVSD